MPPQIVPDAYQFGFSDPENFIHKTPMGLTSSIVEDISSQKNEPAWMRRFRLQALNIFQKISLPNWGGNLSSINFDQLYYYLKPTANPVRSWDQVPDTIKNTFDRLGIPQAEREYLAGVKAQYDSEVVYDSLKNTLANQGVIFTSMDQDLQKHPDLVREYWSTVIPPADNKFAALNSAVWSGGSFIYVPPGVRVDLPLQAYFRINAARVGQFERTLIIADEGSFVHYVEGCTAPIYTSDSLHAAVVEIIVKPGARVRYTTIQNWSPNVYNLVTKRARVEKNGVMEWVDGNLGAKLTMKYPSVYLVGEGAHGEVLSLAYAGAGQHQDAGAKAIHIAPHTTSKITSKSISRNGGRTSYRGLLRVSPSAPHSRSRVVCDALILDKHSRSDTYPTMQIDQHLVTIEHEATVSKIGRGQLFYLQSRGVPESEAQSLIVNGFIEPIVKELPLEYAVELNRLIQLEMEGSVG
jgi:Fe-S cluster assembly protein SufB